jgi:MFS family permease
MNDAAPSGTPPTASTQSFAALRHRGYRAYFIGSALVMMADSIEHVISYWILFEKFQSPALGGFAVFSHWLPFLFFSVYSGALADRFDPRRIIQLGMALFMVASLGWGLLFLSETLEVWHAAVLLTIHGFAGVLWGPAGQLLIHDIVGPAQLQSAVRLIATSRVLGLLMGPAIGGALMIVLGPAIGVLVNVAIYLPLTLWLWKAPYGPRFRAVTAAPARVARGLGDILATIRDIAGNRTVVAMTLLAGFASLIVGNAHQAQMPEFAHDLGHGGDGLHYSLLLAANAAGALVAGIALESRGFLQASSRTAFILVMVWCCAIGGFAIVNSYLLALALLVVAGFFDLAFNSMAQTLVQLHAPGAIRGRVIGLYNTSAHGLRAFSGVTVGVGGSLIGIHWSLALCAMVLLAITMGLLAFTLRVGRGERELEPRHQPRSP